MIRFVDRPKTNEQGYLLKLKGFSRYFSIKRYGGFEQTYLMACSLQTDLLKLGYEDYPTATRQNNTSGVEGFSIKTRSYSEGRISHELVYYFNETETKTVSLRKYGLAKAIRLAVDARKAANLPTPTVEDAQRLLVAKNPDLVKYLNS